MGGIVVRKHYYYINYTTPPHDRRTLFGLKRFLYGHRFVLGMIEIDGSYGEGGGQIVRTALALSTLTGKSFKVSDIRKGRPQPGLKAQHVTAVEALKQICDAKTSAVQIGSTESSRMERSQQSPEFLRFIFIGSLNRWNKRSGLL